MRPVVNATVKVEPNLANTMQHGNKPVDSDVIVISSDSEPESELKEMVMIEDMMDIKGKFKLKAPATKSKGKRRNRAIPILESNPTADSEAVFDFGLFVEESQTAWTDSEITSFVIEGDHQVTAELWVKRLEYLSEIPYIFPIPKIPTAFIIDLRDEKFFIPKSESDPTPWKPDALIKSKVRQLPIRICK